MRAGLAALEGRWTDALAGYREAVRMYRGLGLAFEEAAAIVDLASLVPPAERATAEWEAAQREARETLERLQARPFLARVEVLAAAPSATTSATSRDAVVSRRPV